MDGLSVQGTSIAQQRQATTGTAPPDNGALSESTMRVDKAFTEKMAEKFHKVQKAFRSFDEDSSGSVSFEEL